MPRRALNTVRHLLLVAFLAPPPETIPRLSVWCRYKPSSMHKVCKLEGDETRPNHAMVRKLSRSDSIIWAEQQLGSQRDLLREGPGRATSSGAVPRATEEGGSTSYGFAGAVAPLPKPTASALGGRAPPKATKHPPGATCTPRKGATPHRKSVLEAEATLRKMADQASHRDLRSRPGKLERPGKQPLADACSESLEA